MTLTSNVVLPRSHTKESSPPHSTAEIHVFRTRPREYVTISPLFGLPAKSPVVISITELIHSCSAHINLHIKWHAHSFPRGGTHNSWYPIILRYYLLCQLDPKHPPSLSHTARVSGARNTNARGSGKPGQIGPFA